MSEEDDHVLHANDTIVDAEHDDTETQQRQIGVDDIARHHQTDADTNSDDEEAPADENNDGRLSVEAVAGEDGDQTHQQSDEPQQQENAAPDDDVSPPDAINTSTQDDEDADESDVPQRHARPPVVVHVPHHVAHVHHDSPPRHEHEGGAVFQVHVVPIGM